MMNAPFYMKIAADGMRKNRRLYLPYILTGGVMVMMSYIVYFLTNSSLLLQMKGGGMLRMLLPIGSGVIEVFSLLFMFYTNSLIIRQRSREFGLYSILGMDKRNLSLIMLCESLLTYIMSTGIGLAMGIALSKLSEMIITNILRGDVSYALRIDLASAGRTAALYGAIYALLLINALVRVRVLRPLQLLRGGDVGEKPPRANWLIAVPSAVLLAAAYYIALTIKQPLVAFTWFFAAVIMVVIATYMLFISGSVALCKLLQRNKRYYYKPNHFISVSSMAYRMKRNGAGLASICILITMVLVMNAVTFSLYIGAEDSIMTLYPREYSMCLLIPEESFSAQKCGELSRGLSEIVPHRENTVEYSGASISGMFTGSGFTDNYTIFNLFDFDSDYINGYLYMMSLDDYNRIMAADEALESDECMLYCMNMTYKSDTFAIENAKVLTVRRMLYDMYASPYMLSSMYPSIILITPDMDALIDSLGYDTHVDRYWMCDFDADSDYPGEFDASDLYEYARLNTLNEDGAYSYSLFLREDARESFYGMYGGLLCIAILLSVVFLFAAVLIIYYKQISEGYEDQNRFAAMQRVGMTGRDIRRSINSQVLTVFFAPLLLAGLHLACAFPILWKMLTLFQFTNRPLMVAVTAACYGIFAIVYAIVYKITSNAYYSIVSGAKD